MQLNISGHHIEVTDGLREHIHAKIPKLDRHYGQITSMDITLNIEHNKHLAEAKIHVKGNDLFASVVDGDMYRSIDSVIDKLDRQLRKHKEKAVTRDHNGR